MKKFLLVFLVLSVLLVGCTQMSAKDIAKKMEEKYDAIKDMRGTMVITMNVSGKKIVDTIRFAMKKPNKYWSDSNTTTVVSNGSVMWIYDKKRNEVRILKLPKNKPPKFDYGKFIEFILKSNDVKLLGSDRVNGRDCYVIEVIPKNKSVLIEKEKIWIDKEFWCPIKIESFTKLRSSTFEYRDLKFNTGIPDDLFEFKPPKDAKVVRGFSSTIKSNLSIEEAQRMVNFTILLPKYTDGYEFDGARVMKFDGKETVILYYKKDGKIMDIFESKGYSYTSLPNATVINVNGTKMELKEALGLGGKIGILKFRKGNITVTVVAKLPKDELVRVGKSLL